MGYNPKRTYENRILHDSIIRTAADGLQRQGFYVQADHIVWINGAPLMYNGQVPDLVATNNDGRFIIEVEDALTYDDEYTKEQMAAFASVPGYTCCMIVPDNCVQGHSRSNRRLKIKKMLSSWGIYNITVGFFNQKKGTIDFSGNNR